MSSLIPPGILPANVTDYAYATVLVNVTVAL
jgi:hypothetical protein